MINISGKFHACIYTKPDFQELKPVVRFSCSLTHCLKLCCSGSVLYIPYSTRYHCLSIPLYTMDRICAPNCREVVHSWRFILDYVHGYSNNIVPACTEFGLC